MDFEELINNIRNNNELRETIDYSSSIVNKGVAKDVCQTLKIYDEYASWAIWDKNGRFDCESAEIDLNTGCVLVAYNPSSKPIDPSTGKNIPWGSFHKMNKNYTLVANDARLKNAILGTRLIGCYITDIIKSRCEPNSLSVKYSLTEEEIEKNVDVFLDEMRALGNVSLLVAIGNDTYSLLAENPRINDQYKIIKIPHYSARKYNNAEDYEKDVRKRLKKYGLAD